MHWGCSHAVAQPVASLVLALGVMVLVALALAEQVVAAQANVMGPQVSCVLRKKRSDVCCLAITECIRL